jgi:hypothetical protein
MTARRVGMTSADPRTPRQNAETGQVRGQGAHHAGGSGQAS